MRSCRTSPVAAGLAVALAACAHDLAVVTQHNDPARTGANLAETILDTANVTPRRFGRLARLPVRGSISAQPLYVPQVLVRGTRRALVVAATMHNAVYAFSADGDPALLWGPVSLGPPVDLPDPEIGPANYRDVYGEIGIMSTPVVSLAQGALFAVAATKEEGRYLHRVHRLDLATGRAQRPPVVIAAPGFESQRQSQRPALLLSNGAVYVAFGAYGDRGPYRGWVFAYDADTLERRAVFATSTGNAAGIWMGGQGPAADEAGSIYAITGNGRFAPASHPLATTELGDSFVKLAGDTLALRSWFSPANNERLDREDGDLGGGGVLLIPGTNLALGAGKEARFFLVDRAAMGYFDAGADDRQVGVVQRFFAHRDRCPEGELGGPRCHHVHGSPVFWKGPMGAWIYVWSENDFLKAYRFDGATGRIDCRGAPDPDCDPISRSTTTDPEGIPGGSWGMPGGFLSISADGERAGSGIVWGLHAYSGNANQRLVDGILRAYDASDLSRELWNSRMAAERDDLGPFAKFVAPTVAGGRVFAPTFAALTGRVALDEPGAGGPSLAAGLGGRLFLAWTAADDHLALLESASGHTFGGRRTLPETSHLAPTIAADGNALFLAWVATDGQLHVGRTANPAARFVRMDELAAAEPDRPIIETTDAPAGLAVGEGRVFVAWRGAGADHRLRMMSASIDATSFGTADKVTFAEQALGPPALGFVEGTLYLTWTGDDGHPAAARVSGNGRALAGKRTLGEVNDTGVVLVGLRSAGAAAPDLHLFWTGSDASRSLRVKSASDSNLDVLRFGLPFEAASATRPAAVVLGGQVFVAWRESGEGHHLNVARYSPGELSVYGLLGRP
jgi:hypothetical protein